MREECVLISKYKEESFMFQSLSLPILLLLFLAGAVAVWLAGIQLSNTTDVISTRFGFGQALGGLIFLAIGAGGSAGGRRAGHRYHGHAVAKIAHFRSPGTW